MELEKDVKRQAISKKTIETNKDLLIKNGNLDVNGGKALVGTMLEQQAINNGQYAEAGAIRTLTQSPETMDANYYILNALGQQVGLPMSAVYPNINWAYGEYKLTRNTYNSKFHHHMTQGKQVGAVIPVFFRNPDVDSQNTYSMSNDDFHKNFFAEYFKADYPLNFRRTYNLTTNNMETYAVVTNFSDGLSMINNEVNAMYNKVAMEKDQQIGRAIKKGWTMGGITQYKTNFGTVDKDNLDRDQCVEVRMLIESAIRSFYSLEENPSYINIITGRNMPIVLATNNGYESDDSVMPSWSDTYVYMSQRLRSLLYNKVWANSFNLDAKWERTNIIDFVKGLNTFDDNFTDLYGQSISPFPAVNGVDSPILTPITDDLDILICSKDFILADYNGLADGSINTFTNPVNANTNHHLIMNGVVGLHAFEQAVGISIL